MNRRMGVRCLNCETYCYENVGVWLRFRALCAVCVDKGFRLELYTFDPFASPDRKWFVGVKHGGRYVRGGAKELVNEEM